MSRANPAPVDHPHIREDFAQEMGLYAPIIVEPSDSSYWPPVDRQLSITLDDVLIEDGQMAPFSRSGPNFVAMGRVGNVMLINGETEFSGEAKVGEVATHTSLVYDRGDSQATSAAIVEVVAAARNDRPLAR